MLILLSLSPQAVSKRDPRNQDGPMLNPSLEEPLCIPTEFSSSAFDIAVPGQSSHIRLAIESAVMGVLGVDRGALKKAGRGTAKVALARQVSMYLAHVGCGLSLSAAGTLFNRDRTTVAHACLVVEDRRSHFVFNCALDLLERMVLVMVLRPGQRLASQVLASK
jgi:Bacterial dnaA protein helix-turn-helix